MQTKLRQHNSGYRAMTNANSNLDIFINKTYTEEPEFWLP